MSYYDQQTPAALWEIAMSRMAQIPLPVNRVESTSYLEHRRAVGTIKPPTLGRDADELKRLRFLKGDRQPGAIDMYVDLAQALEGLYKRYGPILDASTPHAQKPTFLQADSGFP